MLKITQVKSRINRKKDHKATLDALGISRMNQTVYHEDTPSLRGMVRKVRYREAQAEGRGPGRAEAQG
jgi:large subunit ribosomal protein L30